MTENSYCKHGLNPKWCAYCLGKVKKPHVEGAGRGSLAFGMNGLLVQYGKDGFREFRWGGRSYYQSNKERIRWR